MEHQLYKIPRSIKIFCMLEILQMVLTSKNTLYLFANIIEHISNLLWMAYVSHHRENDEVISFWVWSQMGLCCLIYLLF